MFSQESSEVTCPDGRSEVTCPDGSSASCCGFSRANLPRFTLRDTFAKMRVMLFFWTFPSRFLLEDGIVNSFVGDRGGNKARRVFFVDGPVTPNNGTSGRLVRLCFVVQIGEDNGDAAAAKVVGSTGFILSILQYCACRLPEIFIVKSSARTILILVQPGMDEAQNGRSRTEGRNHA